jgi:hypothetical protein
VHVHVDQAGCNDLARGIENFIVRRRMRIECGDAAVSDQDIGHTIDAVRRIDDAAILNDQSFRGIAAIARHDLGDRIAGCQEYRNL